MKKYYICYLSKHLDYPLLHDLFLMGSLVLTLPVIAGNKAFNKRIIFYSPVSCTKNLLTTNQQDSRHIKVSDDINK